MKTFRPFYRTLYTAAMAVAAMLVLTLSPSMAVAGPVGSFVDDTVQLTANSNCGVEATGMTPDGRRWRGQWADPTPVFDELNNPLFDTYAVNNEGRWFKCQEWIRPGEPPTTPKPDGRPCPGGTGEVAFWKVGPATCTSYDPSKTSPTDKSRIQGTKSGELEAFNATGRQNGLGVFKCVAGQRVLQPGSTCVENVECSGKVSGSWGTGNSCSAAYEGRLAYGKSITLTSSNGKGVASLYCNPSTGQFQLSGVSCRK